jgi:hypothetical protein
MFFLAGSIESRRRIWWLAASGLMFGLAISCRPHLGLAGAIALAGLAVSPNRTRSSLVAFLAPLILAGAAVAAYNYERFGIFFEFGIRYLLTGENQNRIKLAAGNVMPGLYFMPILPTGFQPRVPVGTAGSPQSIQFAGFSLSSGLRHRAHCGALYCAPFIVGALFAVRARRLANVRIVLWIALASSAAVLLIPHGNGFTTSGMRLTSIGGLAAVASVGILIARKRRHHASCHHRDFAVLVAYSMIANLPLVSAGLTTDAQEPDSQLPAHRAMV